MGKKIRVGVVGVGNCFAGLIEGIQYYKEHPERIVTGVMHETMAGYSIHDIEFVSAFDVSKKKVGQPLHKAVYADPNLVKWVALPKSDTIVHPSPVLDGVGIYVKDMIEPINSRPIDQLRKEILEELRVTKTEIIISYLPVGSQKATEFWAEVALDAGCAFVNCIPVFIASNREWRKRFEQKNLPLIGDDIKGQVGATIVHRILAKLFTDRGVEVESTYQLNVGGNSVTGDQMITLFVDGVAKQVSIGKFIDELISKHGTVRADGKEIVISDKLPDNIECFTIDEENKVKIVPVDAFIRHKIREPIYEVTTAEGRSVKITGDHNVFILSDDGTLKNTPVKSLKEGETYIAVPSSLPVPHQKDVKTVDLTPIAGSIYSDGVDSEGFLKIKNKKEIKIPLMFPVSDEFIQIAGLWIADGNYDRKESGNIEIACENDFECVEIVDAFLEKFGINYSVRDSDGVALRIMSKTLGRIFKNYFLLDGGSRTKRVPEWIFNLSNRQIALFLKGYLSGDGGVIGNQIRWTSVSKELINDIRNLFLRIGINSIVFKEVHTPNSKKNTFTPDKITTFWHGLISSKDDLEKFAELVGFIQNYKNDSVLSMHNREKSFSDKLPRIPLITKWKIKSTTWYKHPTVSKSIVKAQLNKVLDEGERKRLENLCNGDIRFLQVNKIRRVDEGPVYVYDLSTKPYERFVCSDILVHNTDFKNMLERNRLESKEISKTNSVQSQLKEPLPSGRIHIGPSDYIEFLSNTKIAFIRLNGKQWGDRPMNLEMILEVDDKSNSGGIAVDAIRAAKIALDKKIGGALYSASSYLMKSPPEQYSDDQARTALEEFINGKRVN